MLKALFWKEWRESRLLLAIGLLLMAVLFFILTYAVPRITLIATFYSFTIVLFGFIPLFGARAFSNEESKLTFLLSKPVRKQTIVTVKLVSGVVNILIILLIPVITMCLVKMRRTIYMVNHIFTAYDSLSTKFTVTSILYLSLFYILSFFMSSLFFSTTISVLIGIFGALYIGGGSYILLKKWGMENIHPYLLLIISLFFLYLSYLIFMRREVRR